MRPLRFAPLPLLIATALACSGPDEGEGPGGTNSGGSAASGGAGASGGSVASGGIASSGGALTGGTASGGLLSSGGLLPSGGLLGSGGATGGGGTQEECDDGLLLTLRDFTESHPDFESFTNTVATTGIVETTLGADKKPVYAGSGAATTGATEFDQWYRDVDGVNMRIEQTIQFVEESPGVFVYDNSEFFPLDGMGFGNGPGLFPTHNFLFTTEVHTLFTYKGGEEFTFRGDDDLWIFINAQLAVDLGGTHPQLEQTINLDQLATQLGITAGETYPMDIFHAERHTTQSNFRIETTIDLSCIENVELE